VSYPRFVLVLAATTMPAASQAGPGVAQKLDFAAWLKESKGINYLTDDAKREAERKFDRTPDADIRADRPLWIELDGQDVLSVSNTRTAAVRLYDSAEGDAFMTGRPARAFAMIDVGSEITGLDVLDWDGDDHDDLLIVTASGAWILYGPVLEGDYRLR